MAAGVDLQLITNPNLLSDASMALPGVQNRLREAAHHVLWVQANSLNANEFDEGYPIYKILLFVLAGVIALYLLWSGYCVIKYSLVKADTDGKAAKIAGADRVISWILGVLFALMFAFLLYWFITSALPALQQAFML